MSTTDKRILISAVPLGWLHKIEDGSPGTITETFMFDNLQEVQIKLPLSATEQTGDNIDIKRGDGAIIRFPKFNLVLDGTNENDITPVGSGADVTGKGEFTIKTNEAPLPTSIPSMTAFLKNLKQNADKLWMLTLPLGFSYDSKINQQKADGYIYSLVKLSSDIDLTTNDSPSAISLSFKTNRCSLSGITDTIIEQATFTPITWKGKSASLTPPTLAAGDGAVLINGDVVIKESATYSYT